MSIREYDFIAGVETSGIPDPTLAVADEDIANYGQIQDEFTSRQTFENKVASIAALKAVPSAQRYDNQLISVEDGGQVITFWFDSASADAGDDVFVVQPTVGTGRWIRQRKNVPQILDEGSVVGFPSKIDFVGTGVSVGISGETATVTVSGGGGGGGGGSGDPLRDITNAELSNDPEFEGDFEFIDDFEENQKAALTNMAQSSSAARFSGANLTGNIKRDEIATANISSLTGICTVNAQMLAPKATALSPSSTSTTVSFIFRGNVTSWFPNAKKVLILRKYLSNETLADGTTKHIPIIDGSNNAVIFDLHATTASSYNSGTDETTVMVLNPSAYDLDFDLSAADFPDKLRVVPYNYVFKANCANAAPTSPQYETVQAKTIFGLDVVALQGEQFLSEITDVSIDGRVLKFDVDVSPSGVYRAFRLLEDESGNEVWRFFGQVGSATPVYLGTKTWLNISGISEEIGGSFHYWNRGGVCAADNGKLAFTHGHYNSGSGMNEVRAVIANMTDVTPVIADIVTNGSGAGVVESIAAKETTGFIAADKSDLSFMMILVRNVTDNQMRGRAYTAGGTVYDATSSFAALSNIYVQTSGNNPPIDAFVSGTGTSHRTHFFYTHNTSFNVRGSWIDQGSTSVQNYNGGSDISTGGLTASPAVCFACIETATKGVVGYTNFFTVHGINFRSFDLTGGAPSISAQSAIQVSGTGYYTQYNFGYSSIAYANWHRILRQAMISNPSNGNNIAMVSDLIADDGVIRSVVYEIQNITAFQGAHITQYSAPTFQDWRNNSSGQKIAQTFLMNTNRVRTIGVRMYQTGTITTGTYVSCSIFATSAGAPTGVALFSATNTATPNKITKSTSGQWLYFNFDSPALSNGTTYAMVFESDITIDGTNYIMAMISGANPYANGGVYRYNGTTWNADAGNDICFEINGEWVKEVSFGYAHHSSNSFSNVSTPAQETSLCKIDNSSFRAGFRRMTTPSNSASEYTRCGYPMYLTGTWSNSAGVQSTWTGAASAAYQAADFDPNLVLNIYPGASPSYRLNLNTGADTGSDGNEDRSGFGHLLSAGNANTRFTGDADFQLGSGLNFNGSSDYIAFSDSAAFDLYFNKPFAIEIEIKPDVLTGDKKIYTNANASLQGGASLNLGVSLSGDLRFSIYNSAGTLLGRALTNGSFVTTSYQVIRIVGLGTGLAPKIYRATSRQDMFNQTGSYAEATYSSTTAFASGNTSGTAADFNIGRLPSGFDFYDGKLGYLKFNNDSSSFVYAGFKENQGSVTNIQNGGKVIYGKRMTGRNGANENYAEFSQMSQNTALVDSYPLVAQFSHTFASTGRYKHIDIQTERVNTIDNSNVENYQFNFGKLSS